MKKVRIEWLDILKGILIIFVILSHSYPAQIYRYFFTPFFLTMFFWVSGYTFSTKKTWKEFFKSKSGQLLIPFLVLGSIRIILAQVLEGGDWRLRITGLLLQINCEYDEMWFVACLISCSFLFYLLLKLCQNIKEKYQDFVLFGISGGGMILGMLDMCVWHIHIWWQVELALLMCFYMTLGYFYKKYETKIANKIEKNSYLLIMFLIYLFLVLCVPNNVDIHMEKFEQPVLFLVLSWLCILPVVGISKLISKCASLKRIFVFWGQNTLFYYAFGGSVRIILYKIFGLENYSDVYILPLICTVLTMLVLIIPAWFVRKFFPWMVGAKRSEPS